MHPKFIDYLHTEDFDGAGRASVELCHAPNLCECNMITILKAMAGLVQAGHYTVLIVSNRGYDHAERRLAVGVDDREVNAEIAENRTNIIRHKGSYRTLRQTQRVRVYQQ